MPDQYIVVDFDQNIYYFDKKRLFDFINEEGVNEEDKTNYEVLEAFPLPDYEGSDKDAQGHPFGGFCPFATSIWPVNAVFILKNGSTFVPKKREITKTITTFEYSDPIPARRRPMAKKATKNSSKK